MNISIYLPLPTYTCIFSPILIPAARLLCLSLTMSLPLMWLLSHISFHLTYFTLLIDWSIISLACSLTLSCFLSLSLSCFLNLCPLTYTHELECFLLLSHSIIDEGINCFWFITKWRIWWCCHYYEYWTLIICVFVLVFVSMIVILVLVLFISFV